MFIKIERNDITYGYVIVYHVISDTFSHFIAQFFLVLRKMHRITISCVIPFKKFRYQNKAFRINREKILQTVKWLLPG